MSAEIRRGSMHELEPEDEDDDVTERESVADLDASFRMAEAEQGAVCAVVLVVCVSALFANNSRCVSWSYRAYPLSVVSCQTSFGRVRVHPPPTPTTRYF